MEDGSSGCTMSKLGQPLLFNIFAPRSRDPIKEDNYDTYHNNLFDPISKSRDRMSWSRDKNIPKSATVGDRNLLKDKNLIQ